MNRSCLFATITLLALCLVHPFPAAAEDPPLPLTGEWVLDPAASDDVAAILRRSVGTRSGGGARGGGGMRGGGMGGGMRGGGMGGGGMRGGRTGGDANDPASRQSRRLLEALSHLTIYQEGDEFDVTDGAQISRSFRTDGQTRKVWTRQGEVPASAVRTGSAVVVTYGAAGRFARRVRRYEPAPEEDRLLVTEELWLAGREEPIRFRLVYRRATDGE